MKNYLYYSLIAMMTASAVTLQSCKDDEDPVVINNNSGTTTPTTDDTKSEVAKFAVTISLNGTKVFSQEAEEGKSVTINLDKLAENPLIQEALKGYEILSITQDGKEVSGEITVNSSANYEINAIKYAVLEYTLPAANKILHNQVDITDNIRSKDALLSETLPRIGNSWIYTTGENKLDLFVRVTEGDYVNYYNLHHCEYDTKTGKLSQISAPLVFSVAFLETTYLFQLGDKYYETYRCSKINNEAKGYQTEWYKKEDKVVVTRGKAQLETPTTIEPTITITSEKITYKDQDEETTYEYKDGIITVNDKTQFIYDGTYLYEVAAVYNIEDYQPFKTGELADLSGSDAIVDYDKIENFNIYFKNNTDGDIILQGAYDWDNDEEIHYYDWINTIIKEYKTFPFGEINEKYTIFPDKKIAIFDYLNDLTDFNVFTYGNYIVINGAGFNQK